MQHILALSPAFISQEDVNNSNGAVSSIIGNNNVSVLPKLAVILLNLLKCVTQQSTTHNPHKPLHRYKWPKHDAFEALHSP